jgi:hypothetical protein
LKQDENVSIGAVSARSSVSRGKPWTTVRAEGGAGGVGICRNLGHSSEPPTPLREERGERRLEKAVGDQSLSARGLCGSCPEDVPRDRVAGGHFGWGEV